MERLLIVFLIVGLLACEKKQRLETWESDNFKTNSDQTEFKARLDSVVDEQKVPSVKWGNITIYSTDQKYRSIGIDGTYLKWLKGDGNNVSFAHFRYLDSPEKSIPLELNSIETFKKENRPENIPLLKNEEIVGYDYKWGFVAQSPKLYLIVYVEDKKGFVRKKMYRYKVLAKQEIMGSGFQSSEFRVYPNGPKWSNLTDILMPINTSKPLSSDQLLVVSDAAKSIERIDSVMKFDLNDDRFDQIQVYYFLQKSLEFQKNILGYQSSSVLKARVNVGYPENTNTTFYFKNEIRLGHGDDIYYSQLSRDPTIVYHESMHFLIDQVAGLPFQGEGGSINEGFADFYTAVALKKSTLGDSSYLKGPYKRNIANIVKYSEKNGGLYHDSAIVSSLLWQIKEMLGEAYVLEISKDVLVRMNYSSDLNAFSQQLQKSASTKKYWDKIRNLLIERDFPMVEL